MNTNTPMTIKQAVERVEKLESNMERCSTLLFMLKRDAAAKFKNGCYVAVADYQGHGSTVSPSNLLDLLEIQKRVDEAEIAKLRPVIDMANAALRGVLS